MENLHWKSLQKGIYMIMIIVINPVSESRRSPT